MKRRKTWFLLAAALAGAGIILRPWRSIRGQDKAGLGGAAPSFRLSDTAGRMVSLSDFKGKIVLLNFWATWCVTCEVEMPALDSVQRRHRDTGFTVLAASVDEGGKKAVLSYLARHPLSFPVLLADERTSHAYRVFELPSNFLIDGQGRVARVYQGPVDEKTVENDILELQASSDRIKS